MFLWLDLIAGECASRTDWTNTTHSKQGWNRIEIWIGIRIGIDIVISRFVNQNKGSNPTKTKLGSNHKIYHHHHWPSGLVRTKSATLVRAFLIRLNEWQSNWRIWQTGGRTRTRRHLNSDKVLAICFEKTTCYSRYLNKQKQGLSKPTTTLQNTPVPVRDSDLDAALQGTKSSNPHTIRFSSCSHEIQFEFLFNARKALDWIRNRTRVLVYSVL